MIRYRKATPDERQNYRSNCGYPLVGFLTDGARTFPVEGLGISEGKDGPKYEVMAPDGFHFMSGAHSHLAWTLEDAKERVEPLEPCTGECE